MIFSEALIQLKMGKYVKRAGWEDGFCCLMPDTAYIWRILTKPTVNAGNYLPTLEDLLSDDWRIYSGVVLDTAPVEPVTV